MAAPTGILIADLRQHARSSLLVSRCSLVVSQAPIGWPPVVGKQLASLMVTSRREAGPRPGLAGVGAGHD